MSLRLLIEMGSAQLQMKLYLVVQSWMRLSGLKQVLAIGEEIILVENVKLSWKLMVKLLIIRSHQFEAGAKSNMNKIVDSLIVLSLLKDQTNAQNVISSPIL